MGKRNIYIFYVIMFLKYGTEGKMKNKEEEEEEENKHYLWKYKI